MADCTGRSTNWGPTMTDTVARAAALLGRGIQPIPVAYRSKRPTIEGWPLLIVTRETLDQFFNDQPLNIGGLLGEASGGLVDIDLDAPEALTVADAFLPP